MAKRDLITRIQANIPLGNMVMVRGELQTVRLTQGSQVQSDWAEYDTSSPAYIRNKPDIDGFVTEDELDAYATLSDLDEYVTEDDLDDYATKADLNDYATEQELIGKQDKLISGVNVKTINNQSILGSGNINVELTGQIQADWNEADSSSYAYIQHKPDLTQYITESALDDYTTYAYVASNYATQTDLSGYVQTGELANVALSGNYNDLTNTPDLTQYTTYAYVASQYATQAELGDYATTSQLSGKQDTLQSGVNIKSINNESLLGSGNITIQAGTSQVQSNWNETDSSSYAYILNKPDLSLYTLSSTLATVATSGNYNDLSNKPTIPAAQVNSDWNSNSGVSQILNKPDLSNYATNADLSYYALSSSLATVATSGNYNDLTNTPDLTQYTTYTYVASQMSDKQDTLQSGVNIKTINNESILGSGNITIQSGGTQVQANWNETDDTSYAYIQNKPVIPAAQVQADWNETNSTYMSYILNKPTITQPGFYRFNNPSNNSKEGLVNSLSIGYDTNIGNLAVIEGGGSSTQQIKASGNCSHAEGWCTEARGSCSHAEGTNTYASGNYSHSEGKNNSAGGEASHVEGSGNDAGAQYAHAEGYQTTASGYYSHAEGNNVTSSGTASHAEGGQSTSASGNYSHGEGSHNTASGYSSHAEGTWCTASGFASHAEGRWTTATNYAEHACGNLNNSSYISSDTFDVTSGTATLFSVGNGTANNARHNAFEIKQNGDIYITYNGADVKLQSYLSSGGGGGGTQVQADWSESDPTSYAYILNKPDLSNYATNADLSYYALSSSLATVATSGNYNDLTNTPTIPAAQVQADWNETNSTYMSYILNKPDLSQYTTYTYVASQMSDKQDTLVSGVNIKTINSESILGSGNITIESGGEHDYSKDYLTIVSLEDNNNISMTAENSNSQRTIYVSINNGVTWESYDTTSGTTYTLNTGDKLLMKGSNASYGGTTVTRFNKITSTKNINVEGNIMSLIYNDNFVTQTTLSTNYTFLKLFFHCTKLKSAENLILPATTLANYCYQALFSGCTSLTIAPTLPATILSQNAYYEMFDGCTSLTYIKCLATSINALNCTNNWVRDVAASGTFIKSDNMNSWTIGNNGIPTGWTTGNVSQDVYAKLYQIPAAQVQTNWNEANSSSMAYIQNKPDLTYKVGSSTQNVMLEVVSALPANPDQNCIYIIV